MAPTVLLALLMAPVGASTVAVHDPSVVVAYKDASGSTYPVNDAGATRTKYYYVFGTQLGAAYSTDLANWTAFTPTFLAGGSVSSDYYQVFKVAATWSNHSTSADVLENLWAPDVIYNTSLKKWCMYYSVNGDDWMSSVVMDTATKIEGPYSYAGEVVYSGMDESSSGTGNADYKAVTGSSTIASRYLASGAWQGTYGSSCIDPTVFYDQSGQLWMNYGSWSGGIFLIKLNESTGLRNNSWNYGYGTSTSYTGTKLRYDPYMGVHLAGGYYVSGEGSYIRFLKDPDSTKGYYYLFESMGFYSPEGGYTMRVFRSSTVAGIYTDVTGDSAIFGAYALNYGSNVKYGFPILQNYKWSWWSKGAVSLGHNSVLEDEDGSAYIVYHRKYDDGTIYHKVEVHQLFFDDKGWPMAAPFAYRKGVGLRDTAVPIEQIVGAYGTITHRAVDYANLATNTESGLQINADGTLAGAYTGTWAYSYSNGRHFLTLATDSGTFRGVLADQLMEGNGSKTISFTAMNPSNERALWGYRKPRTALTRTTKIHDHSLAIGSSDTVLAWNNYTAFRKDTASGDFEAEYTFVNGTSGSQSSYNWAIALKNGTGTWYLRADAYSRSTISGSTVTYKSTWNGSPNWTTAFKGKTTRVKIARTGTTVNVFAYANDTLIETATATGTPSTLDTIYLGGENVRLDVQKISVRALNPHQVAGTANDDGTYTAAFNSLFTDTAKVTGNFELRYRFVNQHSPESADSWDNWILREISGSSTMLLRSDAYALDAIGTVSFSYDWSWTNFITLVSGAQVEMAIRRSDSTVTCSTSVVGVTGLTGHSLATQKGAPATALSFGLTNEKSLVDLREVERVTHVGSESSATTSIQANSSPKATLRVYARKGELVIESDREGHATLVGMDGRTSLQLSFHVGINRFGAIKPGIYALGAKRILVP